MATPSVLYEVTDDGCWTWRGARSWNGYGRIRRNRHLQWAHRWYYQQERGPIPEGMYLDHLCRNKVCVNPAHLEIVTNAENQRRGNAVRLDWGEVDFIRRYGHDYTHRALAQMFGVSHAAIQKVIHNRSWRDDPVVVGGP